MTVTTANGAQHALRGRGSARRRAARFGLLAALPLLALVPAGVAGASSTHGAGRAAGVTHARLEVAKARPHWRIRAGSDLRAGQSLVSPNGQNRLSMQSDGNLVLYWEGHAMWSTNSRGRTGDYAAMQSDGNFVVYQGKKVVWASGSDHGAKSPGYYLAVQNDGNIVIYPPRGWAVWSSATEVATGLQLGSTGHSVFILQTRLAALGYWLGSVTSDFADSTQQAVFAVQKAAGVINFNNQNGAGVVTAATATAITDGVEPTPRPASGNLIEINLANDLLMILRNGKLYATLNTSTGGGYWYTSEGVTSQAITPTGVFNIYSEINGTDVAPLGVLWRPKFFTGGYAIHGDGYVPSIPVSHGCARVSDEAIDWIWATNQAPLGEEVWVF